MSLMKCGKCESTKMTVEVHDCCADCEHNGFSLDEELCEQLGVEPKQFMGEYFYDESLKLEAETALSHEVERDEAYNSGTCRMGEPGGDGCWIFTCENQHHVDMVPRMTC